jgi:uncharacterized protein (UPF0548 family)
VSVRLRRSSTARLRSLLVEAASASLTYEPTGASVDESTPVPQGLERHRWATDLAGDEAFERGVTALEEWQVHLGAGLTVEVDGQLAVGTNVAMVAPLPVGFIEVTCRIVAIVDEPDRFGFAYGTLPVHPERGEESFILSRFADGRVTFTVQAVSRPIQPLARLVPPMAGALQNQAVDRYLSAMAAAVR